MRVRGVYVCGGGGVNGSKIQFCFGRITGFAAEFESKTQAIGPTKYHFFKRKCILYQSAHFRPYFEQITSDFHIFIFLNLGKLLQS